MTAPFALSNGPFLHDSVDLGRHHSWSFKHPSPLKLPGFKVNGRLHAPFEND